MEGRMCVSVVSLTLSDCSSVPLPGTLFGDVGGCSYSLSSFQRRSTVFQLLPFFLRWAFLLLCLSKRVKSIYYLRLFNEAVLMLPLYLAMYLLPLSLPQSPLHLPTLVPRRPSSLARPLRQDEHSPLLPLSPPPPLRGLSSLPVSSSRSVFPSRSFSSLSL